MRFLVNSVVLLFLISATAIYISGCSTAEQTTGRLAYSQGDFEKAEKEFEKETRQNPSNDEAWFYLVMSRLQLNKIDLAADAMKEFKKVDKGNYKDEIVRMWEAKFDQGYKTFEKAKSSASDTTISFKLYKEAIDYFKSALLLIPDSAFVQKNIDVINNKIATIKVKPLIDKGADYIQAGKYEEAIGLFKQAEDAGLDKESLAYDVINYNMGLAYLKWGESIREANKETNPDDQSYKDKYRDALPYLEALTASKDEKTVLSSYELLVQVYGNLNMTDKALDAIKKRDELKQKLENK